MATSMCLRLNEKETLAAEKSRSIGFWRGFAWERLRCRFPYDAGFLAFASRAPQKPDCGDACDRMYNDDTRIVLWHGPRRLAIWFPVRYAIEGAVFWLIALSSTISSRNWLLYAAFGLVSVAVNYWGILALR